MFLTAVEVKGIQKYIFNSNRGWTTDPILPDRPNVNMLAQQRFTYMRIERDNQNNNLNEYRGRPVLSQPSAVSDVAVASAFPVLQPLPKLDDISTMLEFIIGEKDEAGNQRVTLKNPEQYSLEGKSYIFLILRKVIY